MFENVFSRQKKIIDVNNVCFIVIPISLIYHLLKYNMRSKEENKPLSLRPTQIPSWFDLYCNSFSFGYSVLITIHYAS